MTDRVVHLDSDPHAAAQKLLPWYVSGRLDASEHAGVEQHLAGCPACRDALAFERAWQDAVQDREDVAVDTDAGWANMQRLVDADASLRASASRPRPDLPAGNRARSGVRAWALPAALSALVSAALVAALAVGLRPAPPADNYHALAAPPEDGATAVVRFKSEATESQIRQSLNASGARLVDGPTVTDAYIVRLPRERYGAALATLRGQPAVAVVEALEGAGAR